MSRRQGRPGEPPGTPGTVRLAKVAHHGTGDGANLVIEGDNLPVLAALHARHRGAVDVVYIDPPYNTGQRGYRYRDRFEETSDRDRHERWLDFMRPRLELLHALLAPSGVIFVSIDDHELFRLGLMMDGLFGEANRLGICCWEKKYGTQNDSRFFSENHEYLLCYAKDRDRARIRLLPRSAEMDSRYRNPDGDARGPWKPGDFSVKTPSDRYMYPITTPSGRVVRPPAGRSWCTSEARFRELAADARLWFGTGGNAKPQLKQFLSEVKTGRVPSSLWAYSEVGHTDTAKKELKRILDVSSRDFQTPKPTALVKRCIQLFAGPGALVLDAFAGTGTTGQAVLELNAEEQASRRFILIESGDGDDRYCEALTVERLRRVLTGERQGRSQPPVPGGFRFLRAVPGHDPETIPALDRADLHQIAKLLGG